MIRFEAKENNHVGTHSIYAEVVPSGTLTLGELLDESCDGCSVEAEITKAGITSLIKVIKRNLLKGYRCQIDDLVTLYVSVKNNVKDYTDKDGNLVRVTKDMLDKRSSKVAVEAIVNRKFSKKISAEVELEKI